MPLPFIPIVLGAASVIAGALGVKKGLEAKEIFEKAERIGKSAEREHRHAVERLENLQKDTVAELEDLGKLKIEVFEYSGKKTIELIKNARAKAEITDFEKIGLPVGLLEEFDRKLAQLDALDLSLDAGKGAVLAAMGAYGVYSTVMALGAASTGTAIASLSGVAATNAALAWLGGGALAAGGLGIAGGMWVLGGLVAGPALAIAGFSLASRAEEALTKAEEYAAEAKKKIAELEAVATKFETLMGYVGETKEILHKLRAAFDCAVAKYQSEKSDVLLSHVIAIFKAIKEVVDTPLIDENQAPAIGIKEKFAGIIEVVDDLMQGNDHCLPNHHINS